METPVEYISLEEFVNISRKKKNTVIKRYKEIPGIEKTNEGYKVLSGTRYPYDRRRLKNVSNYDKKRYHLLMAIYEYKYISQVELQIEKSQFDDMLKELEKANLIEENRTNNPYGANRYDCTVFAGRLMRENTKHEIQDKIKFLAETAGIFVGNVVATVNQSIT